LKKERALKRLRRVFTKRAKILKKAAMRIKIKNRRALRKQTVRKERQAKLAKRIKRARKKTNWIKKKIAMFKKKYKSLSSKKYRKIWKRKILRFGKLRKRRAKKTRALMKRDKKIRASNARWKKKQKQVKRRLARAMVRIKVANERKAKAVHACNNASKSSRSRRSKLRRLQSTFVNWQHRAAKHKEMAAKKAKGRKIWKTLKRAARRPIRAHSRGKRRLACEKFGGNYGQTQAIQAQER